MFTEQDEKKKDMIEAFSAVNSNSDMLPVTDNDGLVDIGKEDPNFIKDILSLKSGEYIRIEVTNENYKQKYFRISNKDRNLESKKCRVCGIAKNNLYGLGIFIKPETTHKVFPLFLNDYAKTWKAFYMED